MKNGWVTESNWEYHSGPGFSSSQLKIALADGIDAFGRYYITKVEQKPWPDRWLQDAMDRGSLVHALVLEPDKAYDEFMPLPEHIQRRRGDAWQEFAQENQGTTILTQRNWELAHETAKAVCSDDEANEKLFGHPDLVEPESSYYWTDAGVLLKKRVDKIVKLGYQKYRILDIKTFSRIKGLHKLNAPFKFAERSRQLRYHISLALYVRGCIQAFGVPPEDVWIVWAETDADSDHRIFVQQMPWSTLVAADRIIENLIGLIAHRTDQNLWDVQPAPTNVMHGLADSELG